MAIETHNLRGIVKYANLLTPKSYEGGEWVEDYTKNGAYTVTLILPKNDKNNSIIDNLKAKSEELYNEYMESNEYTSKPNQPTVYPNLTISDGTDKDKKPNDTWEVKFKRRPINKDGKQVKIEYIDSVRQPYELTEEIAQGSDINILFAMYGSTVAGKERQGNKTVDILNHYVTFCIYSVQVLKHKKYITDTSWCVDGQDITSDELNDDDRIGENELPF